MKGTIEDVAASPNDPLFIVHHTMIDCILDEWLERHDDAEYPDDPLVRDGHKVDDFVRGFFPLFRNREMFKMADSFGYSCNLAVESSAPPALPVLTWPLLVLASLLTSCAISLLQ